MAIIDKAAIQAKITLYTVLIDTVIVANGNGDITGPVLNNVLQQGKIILEDLKDSYFNLINEPRTSPNASQNTAYFAETGSDIFGEYEIGNSLKPFATPHVAISAMPTSNFSVISLGGEFTFLSDLVIADRDNFVLDLSNTVINGNILNDGAANKNNSLILESSQVNGRVDWDCKSGVNVIRGGRVISNSLITTDGAVEVKNTAVYGLYAENTGDGLGLLASEDTALFFCNARAVNRAAFAGSSYPIRVFAQTCVFENQDADTLTLFGTTILEDCRMTRNVVNATTDTCVNSSVSSSLEIIKMTGCKVFCIGGIGISGKFLANLSNTDIIATGGFAGIRVAGSKTINENYQIDNCYIEGGSFGVYINLETRTNTVQTIQDSKIVGNTTVGGSYGGGDTGVLYLKNNFYKNAFLALAGITESGGIVDANIKQPII